MTVTTAPYPDELDALLDALCDDQLSDEQFAQLETRVGNDPTARRRYIETIELMADLEWGDAPLQSIPQMQTVSETDDDRGRQLQGRHLARLIQTAAAEEAVPKTEDGHASAMEQRPTVLRSAAILAESIHWRVHPLRFSAVAGLLTLLFWLGFYGWVAPNHRKTVQNGGATTPAEVVASLRVSPDCRWSPQVPQPADFGHLLTGQRLAVDAGLLEVTYRSGARMVLEGPVNYTVANRNGGRLDLGRLVAQVPETAHGFAVKTPTSRVVDLGTCFGLLVDPLGATEVHVFEGRVEVAQPSSLTTGISTTRLAKGQALRCNGPGQPSLPLAFDDALANLRLKAITPHDAAMVVFQDGLPTPKQAGGDGVSIYEGTRDLHLREADDGIFNTGGESHLALGQYADNKQDNTRILIDFDYESLGEYLATNNLQIGTVTLKLHHAGIAGISPTTGQTVDIFPATSAFNEGMGASNGRDGQEASIHDSTWGNQAFPTSLWAGGGHHGTADFVTSQALDTVTLGDATAHTWQTFDVTAAFAADGSDLGNYHGFVLLARVDNANPNAENGILGGKQMLFSSSDAERCRPMLVFRFVRKPATSPSSN